MFKGVKEKSLEIVREIDEGLESFYIIYIAMEKFNKNLEQFIRNLSKINGDENYLEHYDFTDPGDKYLNIFYKNCNKFSNDIANKDEIIFSEENTILDNINFNKIWNSDLTDEDRSVLWISIQAWILYCLTAPMVDIKSIMKLSFVVGLSDSDTKTLFRYN